MGYKSKIVNLYKESPVSRFLISLIGLVIFFELTKLVFDAIPGFYYWDLLHYYVIWNGVDLAEWILKSLGYELLEFSKGNYFQIIGGRILKVGIPCSGLELFIYYIIIILAYPGSWKLKALFIPAGVLIIHLINVARFVALALVDIYTPEYFQLHHHFIFKIAVYLFIFLFWILFVRLSSRPKLSKQPSN